MPAMAQRASSRRRVTVVAVAISFFSGLASECVAQSPAPGLVAAYNFNEGSGTTVTDLSGNNLTGTIVGATWTTAGRYGNALSFDGSSSYVDLGNPAALQLTGSMTLEAWINAAADPPDDGQIIAKSSDLGWQLKTSPDTGPHTFGVKVSGSSTSAQRYSKTVRSLNTWYYVAGVYNASAGTLDIYVNGVLDNGVIVGKVPTSQVNQNVNVNIGRRTGGYYFNGIIDEVRIYNRSLSQTEIQNDMQTPIGGTPPPPDTTPPTISMTAPAGGATVSGTVTVSASASDNVSVAGVQFLLDGANLGSEVTTAPFTIQWNTATTGIGTHTLAGIARDFSNNTTRSASISVYVTNPSPDQVGQWSAVMNWPIVAVHAMLLPSGDVLGWTDYTTNGGAQIWRRATNTFTPKTYDTVSLFCAGHAYMADGRLLIAGGIVGLQDDLGPQNATIFDPVTENWSQGAPMTAGRYYPTATTLPDGRILVQGGTTTCSSCVADIPEIYDPVQNTWTQLVNAKKAFKYYPHTFVLPDGRILVSGQDDQAISSLVLDLSTQAWTTVDSRVFDGHSAAMYLPGKVIKAGTATADNPGLPAAATTYVLDMTHPSPTWQATAPMAYPRSYLNLTPLPDGQVLATGGSTTTDKANFAAAVYAAELWSPATKAWTTMSSMQTPRLYHSTALLMPDATVLVAGGGRENGRSQPDPADEPNAEIFSPPYLFKGPRPVIASAPSLIQYGATFSVATPDAARIAAVSLIALGAATHAFNENQRFVPLTFGQAGGGLSVQAPIDGNTAPPGPYMLFLVDTNGIPSTAAMVRLPAPSEDNQPPTPPGNLAAIASAGAASLTWSASTDNVGVTGYNIHRSTTSGFTPTAGNRIAQTSATSYTDMNFSAAGTYYYVVTAQDAAGNVSSPSNQASAVVVLGTTPPTLSPPGGTYNNTQSVTIADTTAGATIYYTTDNSTPPTSPTTQTTAPGGTATVPVTTTGTILKAMARASGYQDSAVVSATYTLVAAMPTFVSPAPGPYSTPQTVTLGDATNLANIYYTTDGTNPSIPPGTTTTQPYTAPITVSTTTTIKAAAAATGFQNSSVASGTYTIGSVPIAFAQVAAATPQSSQSTVTVAYPAAQTAGDLNIVVVGWNDSTSNVTLVKDSQGNAYSLAIGPTRRTGLSQSIYYAPNIKGGSNTVAVTFNQAAAAVDLRVLEYKGVNTLDVKAGASGSGSTSSSGSATTTTARELIFGANTVFASTKGAGTNFTARIITKPDADIAEDRIVSATGSYSATAPLTGNSAWVMQMATFK